MLLSDLRATSILHGLNRASEVERTLSDLPRIPCTAIEQIANKNHENTMLRHDTRRKYMGNIILVPQMYEH